MTRADWHLIKDLLTERMMATRSEEKASHCAIVLAEVVGKLANFNCLSCGKTYDEIDLLTETTRPHGICVACFTTEA